jgi:hypothetical protein
VLADLEGFACLQNHGETATMIFPAYLLPWVVIFFIALCLLLLLPGFFCGLSSVLASAYRLGMPLKVTVNKNTNSLTATLNADLAGYATS